MKRPASKAALKKPAAKAVETEEGGQGDVKLTEQAVADHNKFCQEAQGMSVEDFEVALGQLDSKASMRLWKAFEVNRKATGEEEAYQQACAKGTGALKKKRQLLFGWIVDGQKTGENFKTWMETVTLKRSKGVTETWLTKHQALAHWGAEELKQRVKTGTILARRDPADKNFWQFRSLTEQSKTEVERLKSSGVQSKQKADKKAVAEMSNLKGLEDFTEEDFVPGFASEESEGEDDDELPPGLAEALGDKKKKKKDKWEVMSQVKDGEGSRKLKDRLLAFKTELSKDIAILEAKLCSGKGSVAKPVLKDGEKSLEKSQAALKGICKLLKDGGKKASAATVLQNAFEALKEIKAKKLALKKALK